MSLPKEDAARLRDLEDRAAITDLVNRYGEGLRREDAALVASCFAEDAEMDYGSGQVVAGIANIGRYFSDAFDSAASGPFMGFDRRVALTPVMSNVLIEIDGDTAHCESMCLAIHAGYRDGQGTVLIRGTRNVDDLVRTPEGWRIRYRTHPTVWAFDVPGTPLIDRPGGA